MNAGRDVERLVAGWLADEAQVRAPDRVLESARRSIERSSQRRFAAAWREPMFISPLRLAAMAAVLAVAVLGAGAIERATAPVQGAGGVPSPSPSAGASLESFRAARDAICVRYRTLVLPFTTELEGLYAPALSDAQRAAKVDALRQTRTAFDRMLGELRQVPVPDSLATDQAVAIATQESTIQLIAGAVSRLDAGDLRGAEALDLATDPNSRQLESFERKYGLQACP